MRTTNKNHINSLLCVAVPFQSNTNWFIYEMMRSIYFSFVSFLFVLWRFSHRTYATLNGAVKLRRDLNVLLVSVFAWIAFYIVPLISSFFSHQNSSSIKAKNKKKNHQNAIFFLRSRLRRNFSCDFSLFSSLFLFLAGQFQTKLKVELLNRKTPN